MVKHDLMAGLLVGVIVGLLFTPDLRPHLPLLVILTVLIGGKIIHLK